MPPTVSLLPFVEEPVEPSSVVHTGGWAGYRDLPAKGYRHEVTNITRSRTQAHEVMPRVHRVASLLKRWLLGTPQGAVRQRHLDYYLDEFTFRFNQRTRAHGANCSTAWFSRPWRSIRCTGATSPTRREAITTTCRGHRSQPDNPI